MTDAEGADGLEIAPAEPSGPSDGDEPGSAAAPRRLAAGALGWVSELAAARDGRTVAVASRDGRLRTVDVASGEVTELPVSRKGPVTGLTWSADSAWLAWSEPVSPQLRQLRMARPADGTVVDVTDGRFVDTDPAFTPDGLYLAFLSRRSFDPVYDALLRLVVPVRLPSFPGAAGGGDPVAVRADPRGPASRREARTRSGRTRRAGLWWRAARRGAGDSSRRRRRAA